MDKISKNILNQLLESDEQTLCFNGIDEPFFDLAPSGTIDASLKYLLAHDYISVSKDSLTNQITQISVTHKAIHPIRFALMSLIRYLLANWIAIAALVISIISVLMQLKLLPAQ